MNKSAKYLGAKSNLTLYISIRISLVLLSSSVAPTLERVFGTMVFKTDHTFCACAIGIITEIALLVLQWSETTEGLEVILF